MDRICLTFLIYVCTLHAYSVTPASVPVSSSSKNGPVKDPNCLLLDIISRSKYTETCTKLQEASAKPGSQPIDMESFNYTFCVTINDTAKAICSLTRSSDSPKELSSKLEEAAQVHSKKILKKFCKDTADLCSNLSVAKVPQLNFSHGLIETFGSIRKCVDVCVNDDDNDEREVNPLCIAFSTLIEMLVNKPNHVVLETPTAQSSIGHQIANQQPNTKVKTQPVAIPPPKTLENHGSAPSSNIPPKTSTKSEKPKSKESTQPVAVASDTNKNKVPVAPNTNQGAVAPQEIPNTNQKDTVASQEIPPPSSGAAGKSEKPAKIENTQSQQTDQVIPEPDQPTQEEYIPDTDAGPGEDVGLDLEPESPLNVDTGSADQIPKESSDKEASKLGTDGYVHNIPAGESIIDVQEESHLFVYFMALSLISIVAYIGFHNKHKIFAIVLEGKRSRGSRNRRRPNTAGYRKLDCNLEEAVTSQCSSNVTHVIY